MKIQWQHYRKLELMADAVPAPHPNQSALLEWVSQVWRSIQRRRLDRFSYWQQIEHLDRCFASEALTPSSSASRPLADQNPSGVWQTVQHLFSPYDWSATREPDIRQVSQGGFDWWYVHDPLTGQTLYLDSEEEVQIWLEERSRYSR